MASLIEMPKMSDTMEAGTVVEWKKKVGDKISAGEVIAEVESDKATMELEAFDSGILRKIIAGVGASVPIGAAMAIVSETEDENIDELLAKAGNGGTAPAKAEQQKKGEPAKAEKPAEGKQQSAPEAKSQPGGAEKAKREPETVKAQAITGEEQPPADQKEKKPGPEPEAATPPRKAPQPEPQSEAAYTEMPQQVDDEEGDGGGKGGAASPLAARMAQELGLDLALIKGTGPNGRVVKRDIEKAKAEGMTSTRPVGMIPAAQFGQFTSFDAEYEDIPNSNMRRIIAQRLSESKAQIPHYYVTVEIDMRQATELRQQLNKLEGVKISVNDFVLKAAAMALEKNPLVNSSFQGGHVRVYHRIDIGVAVAMADGLITPVIRNINKKGLLEISQEARELAERARRKKLKTEEFTGSTFTVSNLGMLGVKQFTAVINPPEAAIIAIGATREIPVVEKGQIVIGQRMDITMASDHRVLDGAQSAHFLQDLKYFLENPIAFAL